MLEVRGVEAHYGDLQALWGVSLQVPDNEIVALIGPNGAGKTTLLRTIVGLHRPSFGSVYMDGAEISARPPHRVAADGVILVPEGRRLFGEMTVRENLDMGAYAGRARAMRAQTAERACEVLPLLR